MADGTLGGSAFTAISSMAWNSGRSTVYVTDGLNVRRVVVNTGFTTWSVTVPSAPYGIVIDSGNSYVYVSNDNQILKISGASKVITTYTGVSSTAGKTLDVYIMIDTTKTCGSGDLDYVDAVLGSALFNRPTRLAMDLTGNIYVTDYDNFVIRQISLSAVCTFTGTGVGGSIDGGQSVSQFSGTTGIVFLGNNVWAVTDRRNVRLIYYVSPSSQPTSQPSSQPTSQPSLTMSSKCVILCYLISYE